MFEFSVLIEIDGFSLTGDNIELYTSNFMVTPCINNTEPSFIIN